MASSINASTSGGGGIITTADSSGNLDIQSGGSTVVAVTATGATVTGTLAATGAVTLTGSLNTPNTFGFKNRIINGGMVIDQRNAGASVTPASGAYTLDRWGYAAAQASKVSIQQNAAAVTPPAGFSNYLGVTSLSAYSILSTDYFAIVQRIEGFNFADMAWGTASASTVTLSFWVRSSLTGTFGGSIENSASNRSYPYSYTISVANTWEQKTVTIAGDTSGTWIGATNGTGAKVWFSLGVGSTVSTTAGAWAAGDYLSATGATSVVGTNGATFYITGVQLEKGSTATSFDFRAYSTELAMCQRYYQVNDGFSGSGAAATYFSGNINFIVTMRASPTVGQTAVLYITDISTSDFVQSSTNIAITSGTRVTTNAVQFTGGNFTGLTASRGIFAIPSTTGKVTLSSEL